MNIAAVIFETRHIGNLKEIIFEKHFKFLPKGTKLDLFISDIDDQLIDYFNKSFLTSNSGSINYIPSISEKDYNNIMTSEWFWENYKNFDRVLIFQSDSEILREGIEEFLEFDYVGAPWKFQEHGGNGGLSIRSPKAMLQCIKHKVYEGINKDGNEDIYFSNILKKIGGNLAPRDVCKKFSCESIFESGTLGIHAIDKWLTKDQCQEIRNQYNG